MKMTKFALIALFLMTAVFLASCLDAGGTAGRNGLTNDSLSHITPGSETADETAEPSGTEPETLPEESAEQPGTPWVMFPEALPEELKKAAEAQGIPETVWVADVQGRYIGLESGIPALIEQKAAFGYLFEFPSPTTIWVFDSETNSLTSDRSCPLEELLSEEETRILNNSLKTYFPLFG